MLPKHRRLSAAEVREVIAQGRGRRGSVLSLKTLNTPTPFKCAVVVSKRVARSAVARNRLRRAVYQTLEEVRLPSVGHTVLFVLSTPKKDTKEEFVSDIKTLLHV